MYREKVSVMTQKGSKSTPDSPFGLRADSLPNPRVAIHVNILLPFTLASASFSTEILTSYPLKVQRVRTPNTMYVSVVLLVIFLSSPSFLSGMKLLKMKRFDPIKIGAVLLLVILIFMSDTGFNEGDRVCAVLFYNIVLMISVGMTYGSNDLPQWTTVEIIELVETVDNNVDENNVKMQDLHTTVTRCYRMAIGMILLSGTMLLRKALWLCYDMRDHTDLYVNDMATTGCTTCDAKNAFFLSFTATAASMTAALTIVRPKLVQSTLTLAFSSMLQCICVLYLYIIQNQAAASMPALFENGCFVIDQCPVAYEMRRIVSSNYATGSSTFLALATVTVAGQLIDRSMRTPTQEAQRTLFIIILLTTTAVVAILIVFSVSDINSLEASIDVALIVTLIGIAIGSLVDEYVGALCICIAITIDLVFHYVQNIGLDIAITYLTVISNLTCLLLFALLTVVLAIDRLVMRLPITAQTLTVCGRSVAWFLAIGSTSLFAIYDGGLLPQREDVVNPLIARTAFSFILWHFAPIIAWIMLARQTPPVNLDRQTQMFFWVTSVTIVGCTYLTVLSINSGELPSEYPITRFASMIVTLVVVIVPCWLCAL